MKAKIIPIIGLLSLISIFFFSCEETTYREYKGNAPVYMSYADLRTSIKEEQNVDLKNPGKIYFKDNYIFIIEELKGIHVFDNNNPAAPVKKTFIKVPGVVDMAISGNILYADSFVDLVILDVQDVKNIHEVGRIRDILPYTVPPTENEFPKGNVDKEKGLVVSWELKTIKERVYNNPIVYPIFTTSMNKLDEAFYSAASSGVSSGGTGIGGSMARFGLKDKVLYLLDGNTLKLFDITVKTTPAKLFDINPGSGIETMFITGNNMFLGTTTGMIIYDITNPQTLIRKSTYNHMRSCDPVVVDDTLAYMTLRSGTNCGGTINSLDVVNIKNVSQPSLVSSYPMNNPYGLGKDGDLLFICDGNAGLKVYDASNAKTISSHLIYTYPNIKAYDVIPIGDVLVLIGDEGLFQYNYSNVQNITLMSLIPVVTN
ncbi:MAG: hypothetical protein NTX93_07660 [Bacteroidia bacterium]|nr:hypothetical protein [Bacteroidia bacterium]